MAMPKVENREINETKRLLRFEPEHAQVWENDSSFLAGVKLLLGVDPKRSYEDKVAHLDLR